MPHRPARISTLLLATAGVCLVASDAQAQSAPAAGRYLTWANRPANTTPADIAAAQVSARTSVIPRRVAPSQSPYRPMLPPAAAVRSDTGRLTPASAWLGPPVAPAFAPGSPNPLAYVAADAVAPAPTYSPPPSAPVERTEPQPQPIARAAADPMAPRPNAPVFSLQRPAAAPVSPPAAVQPPATDPADPMAPRRDARIFQMRQDVSPGHEQAALPAASQPALSAPASVQAGQSGARYYSVHRDAGHRPDPTALPEPVYFDSVAIDLAEPPTHEVPTRDAQGRRRVVANQDPSLP